MDRNLSAGHLELDNQSPSEELLGANWWVIEYTPGE